MLKLVAAVAAALLLITTAAAAGATSFLTSLAGQGSRPSSAAASDIPADYLALYQQAAPSCPGLDWSVLAAIGKIESDHGRSRLPGVHRGANYAGARGPMQFLSTTFAEVTAKHHFPEGGSRPPSPYNPHDAVYAAAAYLCDSGARGGRDLRGAIFTYNRASWYVSKVLRQAERYRTGGTSRRVKEAAPAAQRAVNYAEGKLGTPYVWGGDGPAAGDRGFDCSGLTKAAYAAADVTLPRTAEQQYRAGPRLAAGKQLRPGDLVFYGLQGRIHHVGLYIGQGRMIHAPGRNYHIKISPYRYGGDDYAGATRPI
ncbi:bifunctional lytic transglycosylase/C40 family peptidase [Streptomyces sp. NPDC021622]|uniref:C40 family peptidase n=1 Tax=Streptomyces sp. NPDC021622 TaxID=3155013 RepID=UPI0034061435